MFSKDRPVLGVALSGAMDGFGRVVGAKGVLSALLPNNPKLMVYNIEGLVTSLRTTKLPCESSDARGNWSLARPPMCQPDHQDPDADNIRP